MQKAFGKKSVIFMFLFPAFLIYTAFVIVSIVWAGYYSFFDWSGVGEKVFVGFKNYAELLTQDTVFRSTVWHTIFIPLSMWQFRYLEVCCLQSFFPESKKEELLYRPCTTFR